MRGRQLVGMRGRFVNAINRLMYMRQMMQHSGLEVTLLTWIERNHTALSWTRWCCQSLVSLEASRSACHRMPLVSLWCTFPPRRRRDHSHHLSPCQHWHPRDDWPYLQHLAVNDGRHSLDDTLHIGLRDRGGSVDRVHRPVLPVQIGLIWRGVVSTSFHI